MQARDNLGDYRIRQRPEKSALSTIKPNPYEGIDFYQIDKPAKFEDIQLLIPDVPPAPSNIVYEGPNDAEIEIIQMDKKQQEEIERRQMYAAMKQQKSPEQENEPRSHELLKTIRHQPTSDPICREDFYGLKKQPDPKQPSGSPKIKARLIRSPHGRQFDHVSPKASPRLQDHQLMDLWVRFSAAASPDWEQNIRDQISALDGKPEVALLQKLLSNLVESLQILRSYARPGMDVTSPVFKWHLQSVIRGMDQLITAFRKSNLSPGLLVEARERAAKFVRAV